ncbi:hypothetical protein Tco_1505102 [Tanacetum coccineum]
MAQETCLKRERKPRKGLSMLIAGKKTATTNEVGEVEPLPTLVRDPIFSSSVKLAPLLSSRGKSSQTFLNRNPSSKLVSRSLDPMVFRGMSSASESCIGTVNGRRMNKVDEDEGFMMEVVRV